MIENVQTIVEKRKRRRNSKNSLLTQNITTNTVETMGKKEITNIEMTMKNKEKKFNIVEIMVNKTMKNIVQTLKTTW